MNDALREEDRKVRMLRFVVDLNQAVIIQQKDLTLREAFDILRRSNLEAIDFFKTEIASLRSQDGKKFFSATF